MTDSEQREAARQFAQKWMHGGDEKQDCHSFWIELLENILGVTNVTEYIQFEKPVKLKEGDGKVHTRYIDGYIPSMKVLIEQKGSSHPLDVKEHQSGGEMLDPYEQGKRYNDNLVMSEKARWIVTCNFTDIWIYDMEKEVPEPTKLQTVELQQKYPVLSFLVNEKTTELSHEMEVSIDAGNLVGKIYDAFYKQYNIPEPVKGESQEDKDKREKKLKSLNALCVRLVFCLYAEDSDIFGKRNVFHDYLEPVEVKDCRVALLRLFKVLDQKEEERDEYLEPELSQFPYVNGGLFADEIEIPPFTDEIKELLLNEASADFDWHDISPTIFGAVFESTLNPETRRSGGMHYTSIENIHKVIDPLFLDDLKQEFKDICEKYKQEKKKNDALDTFQDKLASLKFLDPACGSGNFLTETYLSLRRLENEILQEKNKGQLSMVFEDQGVNPIKVSIQQFYGIEINDFAATVAKTALWIAESQMLEETKSILTGFKEDFLPLKTYVNITEGNALRIDWNTVIPASELNYIMGNPPFVGARMISDSQRYDVDTIFKGWKNAGNLDYVSCWFKKASDYIKTYGIYCAFVSTNSICQGESVGNLWEKLFKDDIHINFAHRTFNWSSEASEHAGVHCIIIGFSRAEYTKQKIIYYNDGQENVSHINAYLLDAADVFVERRTRPLCDVPLMHKGCQPTDGGNLIIEADELDDFLNKEPKARKYIKNLIGAKELTQGDKRYCLWLVNVDPSEIKSMPYVMERIKKCREMRLSAKDKATRKLAERPYEFRETYNYDSYIAIPMATTIARRYIPMGFFGKDTISTNLNLVIENASLYHFGILESNIHMAWTRAVCGRLRIHYRYSAGVVYNNFPWPSPSAEQKKKIEKAAEGILDARALYPNSCLSDLYDPITMPSELRKAHTENDKAVMAAYGFSLKMSEADCVAELMKMYQQLVQAL